jgi:hypothetical protein
MTHERFDALKAILDRGHAHLIAALNALPQKMRASFPSWRPQREDDDLTDEAGGLGVREPRPNRPPMRFDKVALPEERPHYRLDVAGMTGGKGTADDSESRQR